MNDNKIFDSKVDRNQMEQIGNGLQQVLNVSTFANPEYNWRKMRAISNAIQEGINISLRMNGDS